MFLPHPILLQIGIFRITAHGLCFALGAEVAALLLIRQLEQKKISSEFAWPFVVVVFAAGLLGARLGYLLLYPAAAGGWSHFWLIWQGGLVSYTGIAAGLLLTGSVLNRLPRPQQLVWWDSIVLAGLCGWGIGRIGNFLAGDSEGVLSHVWSLTYGRVPIQLLEMLLCFGLALWLYLYPPAKAGYVALLGLAGYFVGRFVIDYWRNEGVWYGLHHSQWASLLCLCICLGVYVRSR